MKHGLFGSLVSLASARYTIQSVIIYNIISIQHSQNTNDPITTITTLIFSFFDFWLLFASNVRV